MALFRLCLLLLLPLMSHANDEFTPASFDDVLALPQPESVEPIAWGDHPLQNGELRLPEGDGPHPVIMVIHGGCWLADYNRDYMRPLAAALTEQGFATWLISYRRLGDEGGGWPQTFLDVADGFDHLRVLAEQYPIDLERSASLGHSAGGHLALWLARRTQLDTNSELHSTQPLKPAVSVGLAAISDPIEYAAGEGSCNEQTPRLFGGMPQDQYQRYQDGSPRAGLPLPGQQILLHGEQDPIVEVGQSQDQALMSIQADGLAHLITVNRTGHFEPVMPQGPSWNLLLGALQEALK